MRKRVSPPCASAAAWASPSAWSASRERTMARVAVVTGGTRGIGRPVAMALKDAGCKVVASYASDDAKAEACTRETGIAARKWDVADFDACMAAVNAITAEIGPVEILVNNAGITR